LLFIALSLSKELDFISSENHLGGSFQWKRGAVAGLESVPELVFDFNTGADAKGTHFSFFSTDGSIKLRLEERFHSFNVTFVQMGEVKRWYVSDGLVLLTMDHDPTAQPLASLPLHIYYADRNEPLTEDEPIRIFITKYGQAIVDLSLSLASKGLVATPASKNFHFMAMTVAKALHSVKLLHIDPKFDSVIKNCPPTGSGDQCASASNLDGGCGAPYSKCGNDCYGRCGPNCSCWSIVCGDCQCYGGCENHDSYCSCSSMFHPMCIVPSLVLIAYANGGGCRCC